MPLKIHFISGLPRSGSTLLAAILKQNPRFSASMSGPLFEMFAGLLRNMSNANEFGYRITDSKRERVLRSLFDAYYAEEISAGRLPFDTHRGWCALLPSIYSIFPDARIICCVRSPAWILDSVERSIQRNPYHLSRMFKFDPFTTVTSRVELMIGKGGFLDSPMSGLRQAWFSEHANRLIAIRYESLTDSPSKVIRALYDLLKEECFKHDFENLEYSEPEFDAALGMPGFHTVKARVEKSQRQTILPTDIFARFERGFWDAPKENPRGVIIL